MMRRRTLLLTAVGGAVIVATGLGEMLSQPAETSPVLRKVVVGPYPGGVTVDERTSRAFVTNQDGTIHVLDTRTGALVRTVKVASGYNAVTIAPRFNRILVLNASAQGVGTSLTLLNQSSGSALRTVNLGGNLHGVAVDEQTARVYLGMSSGISVLDARTGVVLRTITLPVRGVPIGVSLDRKSGHLFVTQEGVTSTGLIPIQGGASTVSTIDIRRGMVMRTVKMGTEPYLAALDENASRLFMVSRIDMTATVLDTRSGIVVRTIGLGPPQLGPDAIALDGQAGRVLLIASGNGFGGNGRVTLLDTQRGTIVGTTTLGSYPWAVAVDETRARAYVVSNGGTYVLDTRTGTVLHTIAVAGGSVALDRRQHHLIVLGNAGQGVSEPTWLRGLRHVLRWLPSTRQTNSTFQAVTSDVSR
jgi:DNA-binding beta-propeller fold protein YncE